MNYINSANVPDSVSLKNSFEDSKHFEEVKRLTSQKKNKARWKDIQYGKNV